MLRSDHNLVQILHMAWQLSILIPHLGLELLIQELYLFSFYLQVNAITVFANFNQVVLSVWYINCVGSKTSIWNKCTFLHQTWYHTWYTLFKGLGLYYIWKSNSSQTWVSSFCSHCVQNISCIPLPIQTGQSYRGHKV